MQTLLTRISRLDQYNSIQKTILWKDSTDKRWENIYGKLNQNDNAIFIGSGKIYVGIITETNQNDKSILCSEIKELVIENDQFLQLNEIYPELISRVKANFQPFIHPKEIDINQFLDAIATKRYVNFYIFKNNTAFEVNKTNLKENDRIVLLNEKGEFENLKIFSSSNLIEPPLDWNISISVIGHALTKILEINKAFKRKSTKSNNVNRIEKIIKDLNQFGFYKFYSFFAYHDCLFNKRVYSSVGIKNSIKEIELNPNENVYKISMSPKDIDEDAFNHFIENDIIVVHGETKAKGTSYKTQGETFSKQINIGDYFYLCRGNSNFEIVGRITSDAIPCDYDGWDEEGWLERSYEIVSEAESEEPYKDEKKWWTPNDNSTCILIPRNEISDANELIFEPFFLMQFTQKQNSEIISKNTLMNESSSLNQILFGPPGTGKTFDSISLAVKLATGQASDDHTANKKLFDALRKEGQIEFVTFHQNYSYEDFVIGLKPDLEDGTKLKFTRQEGVFYRINKRAEQNYIRSQKEVEGLKPFNEVFELFLKPLQEEGKEIEVTMLSGNTKFWITDINAHNLSFRKQSGGTGHTLSFDTIEEIYFEKRIYTSGLGYYYNALLDKLWELGKTSAKLEVIRKNFVLVIDEINRANISKVFGELITLLEEDKRLNAENELRITIPNTDKEFVVPPNLYIIGTMNTADKSIALVDIALRRRFEFRGYYPTPEVLEKLISTGKMTKEAAVFLKYVNDNIYTERSSADYLIGHAYLIGKDNSQIKSVIQNKIIPLLMEYFSGKVERVEGIFKGSSYTIKYNPNTYSWDISQ